MRGLDISAIGIIAFLAVAMMAGFIVTQAGIGGQREYILVRSTATGQNIDQLESAKQAVNQNLKFSASQASIIVASQGGSIFPARYWMCDQGITSPTPDEVVYALSNISSSIIDGYVNATAQAYNTSIRGYTCVAAFDPGADKCLGKSSEGCEGFATSAEKGQILLNRAENLSYSGRLEGDIGTNRFWWIYHKLYDFFSTDGFRNAVKQDIAQSDDCQKPTTEDVTVALDDACKRLGSIFDQYVNVTCTIACQDKAASCLNEDCTMPQYDKALCYGKSISTEGAENINYGQEQYMNNRISAQSASLGSVTIYISVKDDKYRIPSPKGDLVPMVWNLRLVFDIGEALCIPLWERTG